MNPASVREKGSAMSIHAAARTALLVPALLLATACAQAPSRAIADRSVIQSTDVVALVGQKELDAEIVVQNSSAATAQFGLIGALVGGAIDAGINASRQSSADEAVKPLRAALAGVDFDAMLSAGLKQELGSLDWLHAQQFSLSKKDDEQGQRDAVLLAKSGNVLLVRAVYRLSPDFSTLHVISQAMLFPNPGPAPANETREAKIRRIEDSNALSRALYYNVVTVDSTVGTGKLEDNRAQWAKDDGALLRRALKFQAGEVARVIKLDLQRAVPAAEAKAAEVIETGGASSVTRNVDGTLQVAVALDKLVPDPVPQVAATPAEVPAATPAVAPADAPAATPAAVPATETPAPVAPTGTSR